jgi:hypothetical protein
MTLVPNKQLGIQIDGGLPRAAYHDGGWTCVPALLVIQLTRHAKCTQPSLHCPDANTRRREEPRFGARPAVKPTSSRVFDPRNGTC